jgi:NAD-dependent dihydropyrimidine dehydrogenase PreA subunit
MNEMKNVSSLKVIIMFCVLIGSVVFLSTMANKLWGGKPETIPASKELVIVEGMTVAEFGQQNKIPNPVMKEILGLQSKIDLQKKLEDFGLSHKQIKTKFDKSLTLKAEHDSKNWFKIPLKFILWFAFLGVVFTLMRKNRINSLTRKIFYLIAVIIFGIILGADPSPMGTVKDAIHLYGSKRVIFPPRMIALSIFLLVVFLANKFICSWGCQIGTLQDLLFRLNRNKKDTKGIIRQYKPTFAVTNSIRVIFFIVFTSIAFFWATDIIDPIDPFKIYKPAYITGMGWLFIGSILLLSLFVYRPWCQMFCPFGLVGWLVEKISLFKVKVDYDSCISCEACAKACPSTVMNAILKRKHVIPDCFACGTCINICPTDSIRFQVGKRELPPKDKFKDDNNKIELSR